MSKKTFGFRKKGPAVTPESVRRCWYCQKNVRMVTAKGKVVCPQCRKEWVPDWRH